MRSLRIAYIGNFQPPLSTENDVRRSLVDMGHQVQPLQEDAPATWEVAPQIEADLVLWTRTWHLPQFPQAQVLATLAERNIPTVAFHLDKYWDLDRQPQIGTEPWWRCAYVFSADGGNQDRFEELGINHYWSPPGVYAGHCVTGTPESAWQSDVGFIGSVPRYHPEWRHRQELVSYLHRHLGRRFKHLGRGGEPVPMERTSDAIASMRIVVGDSCGVGDRGHYWSNRIPETLGRGGFLLHPAVDGIEEWYKDGEHLRLWEAGDWTALYSLIDHYLTHPDEAAEIAARGRALVMERDTFAHRMQMILDTVGVRHPNLCSLRRRIDISNPIDEKTVWEVYDEEVYQAGPYLAEGGTVIDLGANIGAFTLWALEHGADQVLAVEPNADNAAAWRRHVEDESAVLLEVGAWASDGHADLTPGPGDAAGRDGWLRPNERGPVTLYGLDGWVEGEVVVLKMDIEGAEYAVIAGASPETLRQIRFITFEFHTQEMSERCGWDQDDALGRCVQKLAETHHIEILGRPSAGGYVRAIRYDD